MTAARIMQDMGKRTEHWFTNAAKKLNEQIKWDKAGGHATMDDNLSEEVCQDNVQAIKNVGELASLELDSDGKHNSTAVENA